MDPKRCEIEECGNTRYARGWCQSHWRRWWIYGDPLGTPTRATFDERFWSKVDKTSSECWLWTASVTTSGYGRFRFSKDRMREAHQVAYELLVGLVPEGFELDHTCHTNDDSCTAGTECPHRRCVNPAHLEPVTHLENSRRGRHPGSKWVREPGRNPNQCRQGHDYTPDNTYLDRSGARSCRQCNRGAVRRYKDRKKATS